MEGSSLKCCVTAHWKCLAGSQRDEIIKAARVKDKEAEAAGLQPRKRDTLDAYDTTEFICGGCIKGGICMFCHEMAVKAEPPEKKADVNGETEAQTDYQKPMLSEETSSNKAMSGTDHLSSAPPPKIVVSQATPGKDVTDSVPDAAVAGNLDVPKTFRDATPPPAESQASIFRCITCKRLAHYAHLPQPDSDGVWTAIELAHYYQSENEWKCPDCMSFVHQLDLILAWRPYPANAVDSSGGPGDLPNHKARLPREYLVKWVGRSYRRLQWVPHMWLLSTNPAKLKNFIAMGPRVQLLEAPVEDDGGNDNHALTVDEPTKEPSPSFLITEENSRASSAQPASSEKEGPPPALPDADHRIPPAWRTVECVLDIRLWDSAGRRRVLQYKKARGRKRSGKGRKQFDSDDDRDMDMNEEENFDAEADAERVAARERGEEPSEEHLETVNEWETRTNESLSGEQAELVIWAFIKWDGLAYEDGKL